MASIDLTSILNGISGSPIDIIMNYALPIPIFAYAIYLLMGDLKIFSSSSAPRAFIGIFMGAIVVLVFRLGSIALWAGIVGIFIFKIQNWGGRVIALGLFFLIVTQVPTLSYLNISPKTILFLLFTAAALISLVATEGIKKQILIVIAIYVVYFVLITYFVSILNI